MPDIHSDKDITITDPVCGETLSLDQVVAHEEHCGWAFFFCSSLCCRRFKADPGQYVSNHLSEHTFAGQDGD